MKCELVGCDMEQFSYVNILKNGCSHGDVSYYMKVPYSTYYPPMGEPLKC